MMWIFDARTGEPIHGFEEKPVAQSQVPNEKSSPTQPFTIGPPPLARMGVTRDTLSKLSPEANASCTETWDRLKMENYGPFTTVVDDRHNGVPARQLWRDQLGRRHGQSRDRHGLHERDEHPGLPRARARPARWSSRWCRRRRRGWPSRWCWSWCCRAGPVAEPVVPLARQQAVAVLAAVATRHNEGWRTEGNFTRFADKFGRPCIQPPHGELFGINIATGQIAWRVPLGTLEDDYGAAGKDVGATNIGPSIATRSGLLFIGATADERFRAFDQRTGRKLWEAKMSASGVAGPMTYIGRDGRQYVVIAAGGPGTAAYRTNPQWGYRQIMVAFAIPRAGERVLDIVTPYPRRMPIGPGRDVDGAVTGISVSRSAREQT